VAESGLPLGCAHIGSKSIYAILCVSPTAACPKCLPSVACASYVRDRRNNIHLAAMGARYSLTSSNRHGDSLKERAARVRARWAQVHKAVSARIRLPYLWRAQSILGAKALPWISGNLSIKSTNDYIFYLRRCEMLSGLLLRSVVNETTGGILFAQKFPYVE
jgi:hypothetical protein